MTTRAPGTVTIVAGILGAASAIAIIVWPPEVSDNRFSYPFGTTTYSLAQSWFFLQHLGLLAGMYALTRLAWASATRLTRTGLVTGLIGMAGLAVCELFALTAAEATVDSRAATMVENSYSGPVIAIGFGWVLAGVGLFCRPILPGAGRWLPAVIGAFVFLVLMPALFGPMEAGRVAIGIWMLLFAWLGAVVLPCRDRSRSGVPD